MDLKFISFQSEVNLEPVPNSSQAIQLLLFLKQLHGKLTPFGVEHHLSATDARILPAVYEATPSTEDFQAINLFLLLEENACKLSPLGIDPKLFRPVINNDAFLKDSRYENAPSAEHVDCSSLAKLLSHVLHWESETDETSLLSFLDER